jgi:hypothetical protein
MRRVGPSSGPGRSVAFAEAAPPWPGRRGDADERRHVTAANFVKLDHGQRVVISRRTIRNFRHVKKGYVQRVCAASRRTLQLIGDEFVLEPMAPEHNERDYTAWMSSIEHIRATAGFEDWS